MNRHHAHLFIAGVLIAVLNLAPTRVQGATVDDFEPRVHTSTSHGSLPYRILKPAGYTPSQSYPLVLFLHGAGSRGNDNVGQFNQPGPLEFVSDSAAAKYPAFMVLPQCPSNQQWVDTPWSKGSYVLGDVPESNEMKMVIEILDALAKEFSIDPKRVYVSGISMGAFGTWDILTRYPERFAAAVPMSGGGSPSTSDRIKAIPIWNFHGSRDSTVPVEASREIVAALEAKNGIIRYTEYPEGHGGWTKQYRTAGLVDWMFSQVRGEVGPPFPSDNMGGMGGNAGQGGQGGGGNSGSAGNAGSGGSGAAGNSGGAAGGSGGSTSPNEGGTGGGGAAGGDSGNEGGAAPPMGGNAASGGAGGSEGGAGGSDDDEDDDDDDSDSGPSEPSSNGAGCSAGGASAGSPWAFVLAGLFLLLQRRRRS